MLHDICRFGLKGIWHANFSVTIVFSDSLSSRVWLTGCSDSPNSMQVSNAKWAASKPSSAEAEADHSIAEGPRKANLMSNRSYDWGWCHWCKKCHAKREVSCHGELRRSRAFPQPPGPGGQVPVSTESHTDSTSSKSLSFQAMIFMNQWSRINLLDLTSTNHPRKLKLWSQKQRRRPRGRPRGRHVGVEDNSIRVFATAQVVVL